MNPFYLQQYFPFYRKLSGSELKMDDVSKEKIDKIKSQTGGLD